MVNFEKMYSLLHMLEDRRNNSQIAIYILNDFNDQLALKNKYVA